MMTDEWSAEGGGVVQSDFDPLRLYPAHTRGWPTVDVMLGQRCRRWTNIIATLGHLVFVGFVEMCSRSVTSYFAATFNMFNV